MVKFPAPVDPQPVLWPISDDLFADPQAFLAGDTQIREIELRWPSGKIQVLRNVKADQILKVAEDER